jgi:hypothetical protein
VIANATNICDNVVVWDDTLGPWTPPAGHYTVNIDGKEVGIGFYYNPATQVWTAPPSVTASFSPSPIFLGQASVLTWESQNATTVTINGVDAGLNGSQPFTPDKIGKFSVTIVATGLAGTATVNTVVSVVATQAELTTGNEPTVI